MQTLVVISYFTPEEYIINEIPAFLYVTYFNIICIYLKVLNVLNIWVAY